MTPAYDVLKPWRDVLGLAEVHGAAAIAAGADSPVVLACALALWAPLHGHACVDLATAAGDVAADAARVSGDPERRAAVEALPWPDPARWRDVLLASPLVRPVAAADATPAAVLDGHPLVLHGDRLYTQRQWLDECVVGSALRTMAGVIPGRPSELLDRLLASDSDQYAAASAALARRLSVIVGGPGTGKTFTVACLLAALDGVRVGLAAPTGKAAARLTESIQQLAVTLPPGVADRLAGLRAVTVHRLLGPRPDHRTRFQHDRGSPLPYDVVVVDETSMVPLPLMARLVEAIGDHCSLVLVGDPDQLESIEVGAVLGDVVRGANRSGSPLAGCVTPLTRQHRTDAGSPVGLIADAIRRDDADGVLGLLRLPNPFVSFVEIGDGRDVTDLADIATAAVRADALPAFAAATAAAREGDGAAALTALESVRILCAHRRGPYGVESWNRHVEGWLSERGSYAGRPLLANRNDDRTGIVNGDTGILVTGPGGGVRAVFRRGDGTRDFAPSELDELETAYAMTVHKTQGSEYDTVVFVHPPVDSPLVGRELLYTAITRAKRRLVVVASEASIRRAVTTPTRRVTGLADMLAAP